MRKSEFLDRLRAALGKLPQYEIDQSIAFYAEVIDDRIEDGLTEEEAVASLGDVQVIANQIIAETPAIPKAVAKANTGSKTLNIVLLVIFSPIWVPIACALIGTALAIYISLWMIIVSLWAAVVGILFGGLAALFATFFCLAMGFPLTGLLSAGVGFVCIGIGLFAVFGVLAVSKGLFSLTKRFALWIRSLFVKKEVRHEESN